LPLIGGFLLDQIGTRKALLLFTVLICVGQGIFVLGGYQENYTLMLIGRFIFGIGCENMYVGQSAIISEWFINYELPLAISMISSIPLIGSFMNGAITPVVYQNRNKSLGDAFMVGFILCVISLLLVLFLTCLDYRSC
jgi:MFS family permease